MLLDQAGYGGLDPSAPSTLFSPPQHRISLGSAPAGGVHDMFLQAEHAAMFGAGGAAAAAVAAAAGFGCIGAGTTAAQLAESVLLEGDGHGLGAQQLQFGMHSSSFGSSSGGAGWRTSPNALAGHFGALQQHHQQQQHMLHRPSDAAVDVSFRSDQVKEQGAAAGARTGSSISAPGTAAAAAAGKPMSFAAAAAAAPAGPEATAAAAEAEAHKSASGAGAASSAPRLTGWASIAAKDPKPSPGTPNAAAAAASSAGGGAGGGANASHGGAAAGTWANGRPQSAAGSSAAAAAAAGKAGGGVAAAGEAGKLLGRLPPRVRAEVQGLIGQFNGVLKVRL
jgi:hypothetical protein